MTGKQALLSHILKYPVKFPMDLREVQSVEVEYLESHPEVIKQIFERYEEVATSICVNLSSEPRPRGGPGTGL